MKHCVVNWAILRNWPSPTQEAWVSSRGGDALKEKLKTRTNSLKVTMPSSSLISPLLHYRTFAKASAQSLFCCQVRDLVWNTCAFYLDFQIKAETYPGCYFCLILLWCCEVYYRQTWIWCITFSCLMILHLFWSKSNTGCKGCPFRTACHFHLFSASVSFGL